MTDSEKLTEILSQLEELVQLVKIGVAHTEEIRLLTLNNWLANGDIEEEYAKITGRAV